MLFMLVSKMQLLLVIVIEMLLLLVIVIKMNSNRNAITISKMLVSKMQFRLDFI
jgi:hypothetical protein